MFVIGYLKGLVLGFLSWRLIDICGAKKRPIEWEVSTTETSAGDFKMVNLWEVPYKIFTPKDASNN